MAGLKIPSAHYMAIVDQRPKAVPGHTFNEKGFPHNQATLAER